MNHINLADWEGGEVADAIATTDGDVVTLRREHSIVTEHSISSPNLHVQPSDIV